MPYVGRDAASFTTVVDVTVSDDLTVTDDATIGGDLTVSGATTITTADNTTQLTLISTDADAAVGPVLDLHRNSASPADDDAIGRVIFSGENDADEKISLIQLIGLNSDVTDGTEDGRLQLYIFKDGTGVNRMDFQPTVTSFNDDSVDVDFRVESNGNANMLFVDAGNDKISVGHGAPTAILDVRRGDASGLVAEFHNNVGYGVDIGTSTAEAYISSGSSQNLLIKTNAGSGQTERMRILSGGQVIIGVSSTSASNQLFVKSTVADRNTLYLESENQTSGHTAFFYSNSTQTGNVCKVYKDGAGDASALLVHTDGLFTVAEFNRQSNDGTILDFKQAGTSEGTISISGSTTSYNAFSGSHWSRLSDNSKPDLLRGTVIETIDAMCVWYQLEYTIPQVNYTKDDENIPSGKKIGDERYGSQPLVVSYDKPDNVNVGDKINYDHNGTTYEATVTKNGDVKHVQCKVSDTADCTNVYGVFLSWDNDDNSVNDMYVTAVGTNLVRVHKDQTIAAGDLLVSNGDGTAKKQDDDIIRSKTIGKVLTNIKQETYDDGSYTIPCALYCG
jgi:hypothetical protein